MDLSGTERMQLNAYLEKLTVGWDQEAASIVVTLLQDLPYIKFPYKIIRTASQRTGGNMSGHTNEVGNVSIPENDIKTKVKGEKEHERVRIGKFLVRRFEIPECGIINFEHYREITLTTIDISEPNPSYEIEYDLESRSPYALVRKDWIEVSPPLLKTIEIGTQHFFAWLTEVVFGVQMPRMKTIYRKAMPFVLHDTSRRYS